MRIRLRTIAPVLGAAAAVITPVLSSAAASAAATPRPPARSVLIVTLPATSWRDLRDGDAPQLRALLRTSALADLSTRTVRNRTEPGPGYLALGTGARSVAGADDAASNLEPDEAYAGATAGAVFETRTGRTLRHGIGALGWSQLVVQNNARSYGSEPGTLGSTLAHAGWGRRVIANSDEATPSGTALHREAALTLMDRSGRVPGRVSGLLLQDATAPFGLRLDPGAVERAFPTDFTTRSQVVLVEASDLARADAYRPLATPTQREVLHADALRRSDALIGRLLRKVDLARDAVVVVSPFHTSRTRTLTVAAVHAPGIEPGLMESATTRRSGFLQIVDVGPTVLDLAGIARPEAMEGRAARFHPQDGTYIDRVNWLVRADRGAQFRDATIGQATATLVTITITLAVAAALWYRFARRTIARVVLQWAALLALGYVFATFVVGVFPTFRWGTAAYFGLVAAIAAAFALVSRLLGRRGPVDPAVVGLGMIVVLHVGDLLSGAHLELNTVFGYTATVGIRIAGIGNPGSAELSAAALLFAVLITWRLADRGAAVGYGVLGVVLVVIGAPFWGQDYGGALALAPTLVLWWLLTSGRRVRVRTVVAILGTLVVTGLVAGVVDLTRPADQQTHVGRFFERVASDGPGAFFGVIGRKASLMIGTFSNTAWVLVVIAVLTLTVLAARRTPVLGRLLERFPPLRPGLICFATLTVLATALNDSGVQVTGMLLATALPVMVFLATLVEAPVPADRAEPTASRRATRSSS